MLTDGGDVNGDGRAGLMLLLRTHTVDTGGGTGAGGGGTGVPQAQPLFDPSLGVAALTPTQQPGPAPG